MFDYIYYSLYMLYKDKENESSGYTATLIISLIFYTILVSLFIILNMTFLGVLSDWLKEINKTALITYVITVMIFVEIFIFFITKRKEIK